MQNPTSLLPHTAPDTDVLGCAVQQRLSRWNHVRLDPAVPTQDWESDLGEELEMRRLEGRFVETLRQAVAARAGGAS